MYVINNVYSIKFAAKLVKIKQLCKKEVEQLSIFMVLSTYYLTIRVEYAVNVRIAGYAVDDVIG